jgi:hypothetical protein
MESCGRLATGPFFAAEQQSPQSEKITPTIRPIFSHLTPTVSKSPPRPTPSHKIIKYIYSLKTKRLTLFLTKSSSNPPPLRAIVKIEVSKLAGIKNY